MTHTPGPWNIGNGPNTARNHAICAEPTITAKAIGGGYPIGKGWAPESEANARLIAAAPELLRLLDEGQQRVADLDNENGIENIRAWAQDVRAAIAEAT